MINRRDLWGIVMEARGHTPMRHGINCLCKPHDGDPCIEQFDYGTVFSLPRCMHCTLGKIESRLCWDLDDDPDEKVPMECNGNRVE